MTSLVNRLPFTFIQSYDRFSLTTVSKEFSISSEQYLKRQQFNAQTNLAIHPALCASIGILYE
jgi:hypothetical protein